MNRNVAPGHRAERRSPGSPSGFVLTDLPAQAGVSLKPVHYDAILNEYDEAPDRIGFFEIHAENYMGAGGPPHHYLSRIRRDWALSVHGVGLSIGGEASLDTEHLDRLKVLCDRYEPHSFSEHLAWSSHGGRFLNDLLPVPYNHATLTRIVEHIDELQTHLGRRMLLENPSTYLAFDNSAIEEVDFLSEIAARSGCGLLLDVNNVFVSAANHGFDPAAYIDAFPIQHVGEIHLAGFSVDSSMGPTLLIDSHGAPVDDRVWRLFERTLARTGPVPVLIEWDNDVPAFTTLLDEAEKAGACLSDVDAEADWRACVA